jgi:hypothetical protein
VAVFLAVFFTAAFLVGAGAADVVVAVFWAAVFFVVLVLVAVFVAVFVAVLVAGAFLAGVFFAGALATAFLTGFWAVFFWAVFRAVFWAVFWAPGAFFAGGSSALDFFTTLRAAAPARLTKDFLVADAMAVTPIG